jgi:hypothetical protein
MRPAQPSKHAYVQKKQQNKHSHQKQGNYFLPVILAVAGLLGCSAIDLHDAALDLIHKSYKMLIITMESPVSPWSPIS